LGGLCSLLLFNDLLDVEILQLLLNLGLLIADLLLVELLAASESLSKLLILTLLVSIGLLQHLIVVVGAALHQFLQLIANLRFILGSHSEAITDSLLLRLELSLLVIFELLESLLLELLLLLLDGFNAFSLLGVVGILEDCSDSVLLLLVVLRDEIIGLLLVLLVELGLGFLALRLDLRGELLLLELAAAFQALFEDTVELLLLALLVHRHEVTELGETSLVVL